MRHIIVLVVLIFLAGCTAGPPMTKCPDPDPDPNSPCATSHGQTYEGR